MTEKINTMAPPVNLDWLDQEGTTFEFDQFKGAFLLMLKH